MLTGYLHQAYAESLSEFGVPRYLKECGAWILERTIPGSNFIDAMGCYPLFDCKDWTRLPDDLATLRNRLVSIVLVADPFGNFTVDSLRSDFEILFPFKQHYVCDLTLPLGTSISKRHMRNVRKALDSLSIERCTDPTACINEWCDLYARLVQRRQIKGIAAFSIQAFEKQFQVPGLVVFRALYGSECIGMTLWYVKKNVSYYHLGAYSDLGYSLRASFGLFWRSLEHFASIGITWSDLGGSAGIRDTIDDPLTEFKKGWSTGSKTAYLCGQIFDQERYQQLVSAKGISGTDYFPAYRFGEFGNSSRELTNEL